MSQALFADLCEWLNNIAVLWEQHSFSLRGTLELQISGLFLKNPDISSVDNLVFEVDKNSLQSTILVHEQTPH